jgi:hypothetical protein
MEYVIKHLESEVRMFNEFINDNTSIITEVSKEDYKNKKKEFEIAINILKESEKIFNMYDLLKVR